MGSGAWVTKVMAKRVGNRAHRVASGRTNQMHDIGRTESHWKGTRGGGGGGALASAAAEAHKLRAGADEIQCQGFIIG